MEDSYDFDYHEDCLTSAGLKLPSSSDEPNVDNEFADMYIGGLVVAMPTNDDQTTTYETLKIKTCPDLNNFKQKYDSLSSSMEFHMWLVGIIGIIGVAAALGLTIASGGSAGPGGIAWTVIIGAIVAGLQAFKMYYDSIADSADAAYESLCTPQYNFK